MSIIKTTIYSSGEISWSIASPPSSGSHCPSGCKRSEIKELSKKSRTRLRRYLANCVADYTAMITLTYPAEWPRDGRVVKGHLNSFGVLLRRAGLMPSSVCWVLEFQARGAPHFHLLVTAYVPHQAIAELWLEATQGLASKEAGTNVVGLLDGASTYVLKSYSAKQEQKGVPVGFENVGRFWGIWGDDRQNPPVATGEEIRPEMAHFRRVRALDYVKNAGMDVFEHDYGFVAFPKRRKKRDG